MIQRIQTVYLLIVAIIFVMMLFFPYFTVFISGEEYVLSFKGFLPAESGEWNWSFSTAWLSILTAMIPIISLITVNIYKRRILQIRLSIFNIVLMLGYYGLFFVVKSILNKQVAFDSFSLSWTFVIPFISAVLTYLAIRAIGKDEALVRSLDRIR